MIANNVAAVEILLDCGFLKAGLLVVLGAVCRACVGWCVLGLVGLQERSWGLDGVGVLAESAAVLTRWIGSAS